MAVVCVLMGSHKGDGGGTTSVGGVINVFYGGNPARLRRLAVAINGKTM